MIKICARYLIVLLTACYLSAHVHAQSPLTVSDRLGEAELTVLKKVASAAFPDDHFSGSLYVLDFWSTGCSSCMESFHTMEMLHRKYQGKVKIIAINPWQTDEKVDSYMAKSRYFRRTELPSINGDSLWMRLFPTRTVPHHVWVDSLGKVLAVTPSHNTTSHHIDLYLRGQMPRMLLKPQNSYPDLRANSLEQLWGSQAFTFADGYVRGRPYYEGEGGPIWGAQELEAIDSVHQTIRYSFVNTSFSDLFRYAWALHPEAPIRKHLARYSSPEIIPTHRLLWNVSSPEYYVKPDDYRYYDNWALRSRFCVEMVIPLNARAQASEILFNALNAFFQQELGIRASLVVKARECLVLKKADQALSLKSKGAETSIIHDDVLKQTSFINQPYKHVFDSYLETLSNQSKTNAIGFRYKPIPLLDETGIEGNVDIVLSNIEDKVTDPLARLNARLANTGLIVQRAVRSIPMLVISDDYPTTRSTSSRSSAM